MCLWKVEAPAHSAVAGWAVGKCATIVRKRRWATAVNRVALVAFFQVLAETKRLGAEVPRGLKLEGSFMGWSSFLEELDNAAVSAWCAAAVRAELLRKRSTRTWRLARLRICRF